MHSKLAETETQYTHQLEAMAAQLQATAAELQRHKETLANTEELLQCQQSSMMSQLQQKDEELTKNDVRNFHINFMVVHVIGTMDLIL